MKQISSKTIVFIHGAFVTKDCWNNWKRFFEEKGYRVLVSAWPLKDAPASVLRAQHPDSPIATLRLTQLVEHYTNVIKSLPEKPILVGHSLGGLMTQILINRDLAAAGIAIHSVPPQGIIPTELSFYKATWKALGIFTSTKKTYLMSLKDWQYAFTNGMTLDEQKSSYEQLTAPESKKVARDGLTSAAKVDFKKPHAPLLIMAGSKDNTIPASLNLRNYKKYSDVNSVIEYKVFEGRNHNVLGQSTWGENAAYILDWINNH